MSPMKVVHLTSIFFFAEKLNVEDLTKKNLDAA